MTRLIVSLLTAVLASFLITLPASLSAQTQETPYWASLRVSEVNMRVGPSMDYRIDWVYKREGLPVRVLRVMEGWRLVQDPDGAQGWVSQRMLTRSRGALVIGEGVAPMHERPDENSTLRWNLEPGVVGKLGDCQQNWCELNVDGRTGFIKASRLFGAGEP
ncbi:SH3 domain-containing protein [Erythrobacter sp. HA6-11]